MSAFELAYDIGREFEREILRHWPKKQGRRPPLALNLAIDALHRRGFSDGQIAIVVNAVLRKGAIAIPGVKPGADLKPRYVTIRRQRAKIRRRG
jgi:hypothetical protein